jgi:hypothetical protein
MALSITGLISASQINTELGRSSTAQFSWGDETFRKLTNLLGSTTTIDADSGRGSSYIGATTTNVTLTTKYGTPPQSGVYKFLIDSGVIIGGSSATSLVVGQFPAGSTVYVYNYGGIEGVGGGANSGTGGDAIDANYGSQTVNITNNVGAYIYAGGGGGGAGGSGGTGGGGGSGYYDTYQYQSCGPDYAYLTYDTGVGCAKNTNYWNNYTRTGTSGGAGGAGGSGGAGGVGQGYKQTNTAGSGGGAGSGGAAGGSGAGAGGSGGDGGSGGGGGTWGVNGSGGGTGSKGGTGASGNNGDGAAGTAGAGGGGAGSAGRYLVKGSNSVTLTNYGSLAGGLA